MIYLICLHECVFVKLLVGLRDNYSGVIIAKEK